MTTSPSTRTAPRRPARAWARERALGDRARAAGPAAAAALRRDALAALAADLGGYAGEFTGLLALYEEIAARFLRALALLETAG